eukprot:6916201-Prymnesium_polylepis.2
MVDEKDGDYLIMTEFAKIRGAYYFSDVRLRHVRIKCAKIAKRNMQIKSRRNANGKQRLKKFYAAVLRKLEMQAVSCQRWCL